MNTLAYILSATILVSLLSLIGVLLLSLKKKLDKLLPVLVSFAVGGLLGGAFLHLLPESISTGTSVFMYVIFGIILFFILERFLYWRHCHKGKCRVHTFTYLNLIGDGIHNFIDGMTIAASFIINIPLGIASTLAIIFHEIPQEIGDFAILVYGGFSRLKALFYNFISALTAIVGAVFTYFFAASFEGLVPFLLPFAAGGFIYIAMSDLMPELQKEKKLSRSFIQFMSLLVGIGFMLMLKLIYY